MAIIEHHILKEDNALAMDLMVLEAKIRERFQELEYRLLEADPKYFENYSLSEYIDKGEIEDLLPKEWPPLPIFEDLEEKSPRKPVWETVGLAALLAVMTALGVFGLASVLHILLSWLV